MDPTGVALWLLNTAAAPDAYTRIGNHLRRPLYKRLARKVHKDTGLRPGRPYKKWLRAEETRADLTRRRVDAYDRLVHSLTVAEARGTFRRRPEDPARAEQLVDATIDFFLPMLDPAMATAIADDRAEDRHDEQMARYDASDSFEQRLALMPPPMRDVLTDEQVHRRLAERLVDGLLRGDPRTVIEGWCKNQPGWLTDAPAVVLLALAQAAQSFQLRREASAFFEQVGDLGLESPHWYARAAFEASSGDDDDRVAAMLTKARAAGDDALIDVVAAAVENNVDGVLAAVDRDTALSNPFIASVYGFAIHRARGLDEAITFFAEVVARHPDYTGPALRLAQLRLERSTKAGTTSRQLDQRAALELAEHARDVRRVWRGDSREAVEVACRAALLAGDYPRVIELGSAEPAGTAQPEEAADPEVQFSVAQAAIGAGDRETVERLAALTDGLHQALIRADLAAAAGGTQAEIDALFEQAWPLAVTEENKVAYWLSASMAGIEPLPGADELAQCGNDIPLICAASQHIARERYADALELLRPVRDSETARRLLTNTYMRMGDVDAAIAELLDMAQRFANVDHRVRVVEILVGADRMSEAAGHADRTLPMVHHGRERDFLHEVGVAYACNRGAWPDAETRARTWINDSGPNRRRRWLLVLALYNQDKPEDAWRVHQEGGDSEPESAVEAQLWIVLHARNEPSPETLSQILAVTDRFPGDIGVRRAAVNAFFVMGDEKGEVSPEELPRWHELIQDRAEGDDPTDTFITINVGDDVDAMVEAFRAILEPQAQRVAEWRRKVRHEGFPYGTLATAAGRSYTKTLVHRAAGYLPIASPDPAVVAVEREAAAAALDGNVIADNSVLTTAAYIKERWPHLLGAFATVEVTTMSRRDAALAADLTMRSNETLGWDVTSGSMTLHTTDDDVLDLLEAQLTWVNEQMATLTVRASAPGAPGQPTPEHEGLAPWLAAFEAARDAGVALWADDVGLRTLARYEGVATFGTDSLLHALVAAGRLSADEIAGDERTLRDEYCTEFPLDEEWLLESAEGDEWVAGPAALAMSGRSTWVDLQVGYALWSNIVSKAGANEPSKVAPWVYAAATGIAAVVTDALTAVQLVASVLVRAADAVGGEPDAFAACARSAKAALADKGLPDATELALEQAFESLAQRHGPAAAATRMSRLGAELADDQREALRRILFDL